MDLYNPPAFWPTAAAAARLFYRSLFAAILGFALFFLAAGCQQKKEADSVVSGPTDPKTGDPSATAAAWVDSSFFDASAAVVSLKASVLSAGGPSTPLMMTYAQANLPVALFAAGSKAAEVSGSSGGSGGSGQVASPMPFLAFVAETKAAVTVRQIKSVDGKNVGSQVVVPVECPAMFVSGLSLKEGERAYCVPMINAVIPSFLVPSDSSGAYVHEFIVSAKNPAKAASVLATKLAVSIVIPGATLKVSASPAMKALPLSGRLSMATNDLIGSPRRDFQAFAVDGSVAPGVSTAWILEFTNLQMTMQEELFFEQPVVVGRNPALPTVSRGGSFYKRSTTIDSLRHFRLRLQDGSNTANFYNVVSSPSGSVVEIPITDGTAPLHMFIVPDFASENATTSMTEYIKPFSPTFCQRQQGAFQPEEWLKSRSVEGFVACEAVTRKKVLNTDDARKLGLTTPIETFFGSFSYMPRLGQSSLGGTNGVLSLRVSLSGSLTVSVRDPYDQSKTTVVGRLPISYSYQFPTVLSEIASLIAGGRATPGMDTLLSAMTSKGIFELPRVATADGGSTPAFPFLGISSDAVFY